MKTSDLEFIPGKARDLYCERDEIPFVFKLYNISLDDDDYQCIKSQLVAEYLGLA